MYFCYDKVYSSSNRTTLSFLSCILCASMRLLNKQQVHEGFESLVIYRISRDVFSIRLFFFGFLIRITQSRDQKTCSLEDVFITNSPLFGGLAVYAFAKATQAHATMGVVANKFFPPLTHKGPLRCFFGFLAIRIQNVLLIKGTSPSKCFRFHRIATHPKSRTPFTKSAAV